MHPIVNVSDRRTLSLPQNSPTPPMPHVTPPRKPMVAKGHDAILKGMQDRSAQIHVMTISGEVYEGAVIARDRWTITVRVPGGHDHTIYKHAIESFNPIAVKA